MTKRGPFASFEFIQNSLTILVICVASCLFVIDSSPAVRRLVEQASSAEGYEVTAFDDGPSALDAAKRRRPELVIADYHLEGIKFTDFCEELDKLDSTPTISIISLINLADRPNEERLRSLGVKAFLKKPIQPDHLGQALKKLRSDTQQAASAPKVTTRKIRTWPPISQETAEDGGRAPDLDDLDEVETADESLEINPVIPPAPSSKPKVAEIPVQAGAREKSEAPAEDAKPGPLPTPTQSTVEQVERRVSQLVPDLVARLVAREVATQLKQIVQFEITTQLATAISLEQITKVLRGAVERELPTIAAQHISEMERTIQQNLSDTADQSLEKITDKLVRELVDPTVRKHLPEVVRQQLDSMDRLVKEAAREAASQFARQAAEDIVREMAKDTIKQVVKEIVPDMAEAEIKKEIERLTA